MGNLSNEQIRKKMNNVTEQFQFVKAEAALSRLLD
jgi:hypothetical protein